MRRVQAQVGHERLGEALDGKFGGRVGRVGHAGTDRGPKAVDATDVHQMPFGRSGEHRQESATAVVDAPPAHAEGALPFGTAAVDKAPATANACVVEHQVDVACVVFSRDRITKSLQLVLAADVGLESGHTGARRCGVQGQLAAFVHGVLRQVAHGDMHATGCQLMHQCATDAGAAAGDHGNVLSLDVHAKILG
jgi:hypothetical protein